MLLTDSRTPVLVVDFVGVAGSVESTSGGGGGSDFVSEVNTGWACCYVDSCTMGFSD